MEDIVNELKGDQDARLAKIREAVSSGNLSALDDQDVFLAMQLAREGFDKMPADKQAEILERLTKAPKKE